MVRIFRIATSKNAPTPTPTNTISAVLLIISLTCPASTERSGSATVTSTPSANETSKSNHTLPDLESPEPTCVPIGVIAMSAPRLNSPIPSTSNSEQTRNVVSSAPERFRNGVKFNSTTKKLTGRTQVSASRSFSDSIRNMIFPPF